MERKEFRITINAPKEKVWETLWGKNTYRAWTSAFAEGSTVETDDWKKDSKVLFLDGKGNGMVSTVVENIPYRYMSFKHLGEIKNGVEDMSSTEVSQWSGAMENYTLKEEGKNTEVVVDMDISEEFSEMFSQTWPKALNKLKELAEQN
jgi:hypothetical protein